MKIAKPSNTVLGLLAGIGLGAAAATALAAAQLQPTPSNPTGPPPEWLLPNAPGTVTEVSGGMTNTYPAVPPVAIRDQAPQIMTVDILATDIDKSVKFYEDVMGMKVFMRRGTDSFRSVFLAFPSNDGKTLTLPAIRIMRDPNYVHNQRLPHMVLAVADVQAYVKRSDDAGYPVTRNRGTLAFLNDPSGNITEVVTYRPGAFQVPGRAR